MLRLRGRCSPPRRCMILFSRKQSTHTRPCNEPNVHNGKFALAECFHKFGTCPNPSQKQWLANPYPSLIPIRHSMGACSFEVAFRSHPLVWFSTAPPSTCSIFTFTSLAISAEHFSLHRGRSLSPGWKPAMALTICSDGPKQNCFNNNPVVPQVGCPPHNQAFCCDDVGTLPGKHPLLEHIHVGPLQVAVPRIASSHAIHARVGLVHHSFSRSAGVWRRTFRPCRWRRERIHVRRLQPWKWWKKPRSKWPSGERRCVQATKPTTRRTRPCRTSTTRGNGTWRVCAATKRPAGRRGSQTHVLRRVPSTDGRAWA